MTTTTLQTILNTSKQLFASQGYEGFSMRTLSSQSGVGLSSVPKKCFARSKPAWPLNVPDFVVGILQNKYSSALGIE